MSVSQTTQQIHLASVMTLISCSLLRHDHHHICANGADDALVAYRPRHLLRGLWSGDGNVGDGRIGDGMGNESGIEIVRMWGCTCQQIHFFT